MIVAHPLDALGGGDDVHQLDVLDLVVFDELDGRGGGAAGGQHGVQDDHVALGDIGGHLAVVFHRFQGLRVPVKADVAHLGGGDEGEDAVHHAQTGPQHRNDGQLFAGDALEGSGGDGRLDLHVLQRQVAGGLIAHQGGDLGDDLAEVLDAGVLISQDGELVLEQRVIQNVYLFHVHGAIPLCFVLLPAAPVRPGRAGDSPVRGSPRR